MNKWGNATTNYNTSQHKRNPIFERSDTKRTKSGRAFIRPIIIAIHHLSAECEKMLGSTTIHTHIPLCDQGDWEELRSIPSHGTNEIRTSRFATTYKTNRLRTFG